VEARDLHDLGELAPDSVSTGFQVFENGVNISSLGEGHCFPRLLDWPVLAGSGTLQFRSKT